jgi:hypothetical protein
MGGNHSMAVFSIKHHRAVHVPPAFGTVGDLKMQGLLLNTPSCALIAAQFLNCSVLPLEIEHFAMHVA